MGCTFSAPEVTNGGTYYVNPVGAAASDAFGFQAAFTTGIFTCAGPLVTPVIVQTLSGATTTYTCNNFNAGHDTSVLCPALPRASMEGEFGFYITIPYNGGQSTLDVRGWQVITSTDAVVTSGTTFTINDFSTATAAPSTVTRTLTVDSNQARETVTQTSYGLTRHIDVPVTSTVTSTVTKTTSVKACAAPVRRVRGVKVAEPEPRQLAKREAGYYGFDGTLGSDATLTVYSTVKYETDYSYGTVTANGEPEISTVTVDGDGTITTTITTRVHDATTTYTTISKTSTTKSTTTITNYPSTCS
ncbi:hypothetical protein ABW20_dc0100014 [Dactylellina cionopaga]|nr:hypothetical protein ABW20_dc0100014 [Dactylellina cionopaga]